jgi:O-antigen/teichoic acid export membrane protein
LQTSLVRKIGHYGVASGVPSLINFAGMATLTHLLTRAEYGQYALVQAVVAVVNAVAFQWLRSSARRFLPAAGNERFPILATLGAGFLALVALTMLGALVTMAAVRSDPTRWFVALGLLLLIAQAWYELNSEIVLAEINPQLYGLVGLGRAIVFLGLGVSLAALGFGAPGVLLAAVAGYASPGLVLAHRYWRRVRLGEAERSRARSLVRYGLPLTGSYAFQFVMDSSDRLLLGALVGVEAAGVYAVAYDLTQQTLTFLMVVVNLAAFPMAARSLDREGIAGAREGLRVQASILALLALPGAVGLGTLAPTIGRALLGAQFSAAAAALVPIIAIGGLLGGFKAYYFDLSFQLDRQTRPLVVIGLLGATLNLALNILWIPAFGMFGAAWATVTTFALALLASGIAGRQHVRLPLPWLEWGKVALIAIALGGMLQWLPHSMNAVLALLIPVLAGVLLVAIGAFALDVAGFRRWLRSASRTAIEA